MDSFSAKTGFELVLVATTSCSLSVANFNSSSGVKHSLTSWWLLVCAFIALLTSISRSNLTVCAVSLSELLLLHSEFRGLEFRKRLNRAAWGRTEGSVSGPKLSLRSPSEFCLREEYEFGACARRVEFLYKLLKAVDGEVFGVDERADLQSRSWSAADMDLLTRVDLLGGLSAVDKLKNNVLLT